MRFSHNCLSNTICFLVRPPLSAMLKLSFLAKDTPLISATFPKGLSFRLFGQRVVFCVKLVQYGQQSLKSLIPLARASLCK